MPVSQWRWRADPSLHWCAAPTAGPPRGQTSWNKLGKKKIKFTLTSRNINVKGTVPRDFRLCWTTLWIVELTYIYNFAFKFSLKWLQPEIVPIICCRCRWYRCRATGSQFAAGINNTSCTGGKFATSVVDTGDKFATGVVTTG